MNIGSQGKGGEAGQWKHKKGIYEGVEKGKGNVNGWWWWWWCINSL
jgi:hypothetical protein